MATDGAADRRRPPPQMLSAGNNGNCVMSLSNRLRLMPNKEHKAESYEDLQHLEFSPLLFSSLERYLPPTMLNASRDLKLQYMRDILLRYSPESERTRVQRHREYRQKIIAHYQPLQRELYTLQAAKFFVPSFLRAISENTEASFRNILSEPSPGVYTFEMLQPDFCELLLTEVENFEGWVHETNFRIMRPNTMNRYGCVLDDFGLETMLDKLMEDFIRPLSKLFFPEVGGSTLDTHHGFVVEYGSDRDEIFDYTHVPGHAILHHGRHRHGARATTSGHRVNLLLWCRSSVFRELKKYQKDFSKWCGECKREKKERQRQSIAATKLEILKRDGQTAS
ncbi:unnamed protein product [Malus baccata var. baccata]